MELWIRENKGLYLGITLLLVSTYAYFMLKQSPMHQSFTVHQSRPKSRHRTAIAIDHEQHTIDTLMNSLSSKDYSTWNKDLNIGNETWRKFTPDLLLDTLTHSKIFFNGDSLMHQLVGTLFYILHCSFVSTNRSEIDPLDLFFKSNYSQLHLIRYKSTRANDDTHLQVLDRMGRIFDNYRSLLQFPGQSFQIKDRVLDIMMWSRLFQQDIGHGLQNMRKNNTLSDVLYTDLFLLHGLHLYPVRNELNATIGLHLSDILTILKLNTIVDKAYKYAVSLNLKCLIVRTPNPICNDKYINDYRFMSRWYDFLNAPHHLPGVLPKKSTTLIERNGFTLNTNDLRPPWESQAVRFGTMVNECVDFFSTIGEQKLQDMSLSLEEYCRKYTLSYSGTQVLSDAVIRAVTRTQELLSNNTTKLLLLDAFKLFDGHCYATQMKDGRHYLKIKLVEFYALTNMIRNHCQ
eukprot:313618_1